MLTIAIPDTIEFLEVKMVDLPLDWNVFPASFPTAEIGDRFIQQNDFVVLKVLSAMVQGDYNFLINPFHQDFK